MWPMGEITLREHLTRIAGMGGRARALKLSPRRRRAIAIKASAAAVEGRRAIPAEKRSALARAAALARWAK
jgi:hypothetical protein